MKEKCKNFRNISKYEKERSFFYSDMFLIYPFMFIEKIIKFEVMQILFFNSPKLILYNIFK